MKAKEFYKKVEWDFGFINNELFSDSSITWGDLWLIYLYGVVLLPILIIRTLVGLCSVRKIRYMEVRNSKQRSNDGK